MGSSSSDAAAEATAVHVTWCILVQFMPWWGSKPTKASGMPLARTVSRLGRCQRGGWGSAFSCSVLLA